MAVSRDQQDVFFASGSSVNGHISRAMARAQPDATLGTSKFRAQHSVIAATAWSCSHSLMHRHQTRHCHADPDKVRKYSSLRTTGDQSLPMMHLLQAHCTRFKHTWNASTRLPLAACGTVPPTTSAAKLQVPITICPAQIVQVKIQRHTQHQCSIFEWHSSRGHCPCSCQLLAKALLTVPRQSDAVCLRKPQL